MNSIISNNNPDLLVVVASLSLSEISVSQFGGDLGLILADAKAEDISLQMHCIVGFAIGFRPLTAGLYRSFWDSSVTVAIFDRANNIYITVNGTLISGLDSFETELKYKQWCLDSWISALKNDDEIKVNNLIEEIQSGYRISCL